MPGDKGLEVEGSSPSPCFSSPYLFFIAHTGHGPVRCDIAIGSGRRVWVKWFMSRIGERPYDIAMSPELRIAVRERRLNPDGKLLPVRIELRGGTEIFAYPWDQMKLGDFFYVPLRGRKAEPLSVRLRQAAARRDWELTIVQWRNGSEHVLRVCLTLLDVSQIKAKAQQFHDVRNIRFGDGKWSGTRKARYLRAKGQPRLRVVVAPDREAEKDRPIEVAAPIIVAEPEQSDLGEDLSLSPNYDRAAIVRERLAKLGISPK